VNSTDSTEFLQLHGRAELFREMFAAVCARPDRTRAQMQDFARLYTHLEMQATRMALVGVSTYSDWN
jgi:hypothetical protein